MLSVYKILNYRLEEQMEKLKPMLTEASKSRDAAKDELEGKEKKAL